jgi:Kef-type K+ transport system membrane component KefB
MIVLAIVVGIATGGGSTILVIVLVSIEGILFVLVVIFIRSILLPQVGKRLAGRREPTHGVEQKRHDLSPLPLAIIVCLGLSFAASFISLAAIIGAS